MEPLASVVHSHKMIQIRPGEKVAIMGGGGAVGLMHLQLALFVGAAEVIAVDSRSTSGWSMPGSSAPRAIINAGRTDAVRAIGDLTSGAAWTS